MTRPEKSKSRPTNDVGQLCAQPPRQLGGIHDGSAEEAGVKLTEMGVDEHSVGVVRTVTRLWQQRPAHACAIHTRHIDLSFEPIRLELVTRLKQDICVPAIEAEIAGRDAHS